MKREAFFDRDASHYYCEDGKAVGAYCREQFPEDVAQTLAVADGVCRKYFLFNSKWDLEQTDEPVQFDGAIDWTYMPADDPEFVWQFNRHRFFMTLGQAYQMTGDEKYARAFMEIAEDWIDHVPLNEKYAAGPWRSLDTGFRGEYWSKAIWLFHDSPTLTEAFLQKYYDSMILQAEHIMECHSAYHYMSNWGVIENHGLFEIGVCLPQSEKTKQFIAFAVKNLEVQVRMQIMPDGVHWEQSPMYHNEVLHCLLDVILLAKRNDIALPDVILRQTEKMAMADVAWLKPDHHIVMMGDSDDVDVRDRISVAAYLFLNPVLRFGGFDRLDYESIWDLGMKAGEEYAGMERRKPDFTSLFLEHSGNTYFRSDWSERANFLHLHSGTMGAGHGHSDKLHIDLVVNGEDVLMDGGRYTYVSGPKRFSYKDPSGHNTITVDDLPFTVCKDSWECSKLSQPVKENFRCTKLAEFAQAGQLGYMDLPSGVYVNRKVVYIKPDLYVLADEMYTGDRHTYQQYFHFNNHGTVTQNAPGEKKFPCVAYRGKMAEADFYFVSAQVKAELKSGHIARHYNVEEENTVCKVTKQGEGFTSLITVIDAQPGRPLSIEKLPVRSALKQTDYPETMAEALKITAGEKEYVVILCHQEVNSPTDLVEADGCMGYGNVIVFDKAGDVLVGDVLNW